MSIGQCISCTRHTKTAWSNLLTPEHVPQVTSPRWSLTQEKASSLWHRVYNMFEHFSMRRLVEGLTRAMYLAQHVESAEQLVGAWV